MWCVCVRLLALTLSNGIKWWCIYLYIFVTVADVGGVGNVSGNAHGNRPTRGTRCAEAYTMRAYSMVNGCYTIQHPATIHLLFLCVNFYVIYGVVQTDRKVTPTVVWYP